jgi:uncharacterized OB-fold protein
MKNNRQEENKKKEEKITLKKQLDFDYCPKHEIYYPKGSNCPKCEQEKGK